MINKHVNEMFVLLLNVNDYQLSSLQVVGDHCAIIMETQLAIYLCIFFIT